ncbi:NAD(P)H dehydrogenase assembly family protein [Synechococcus sp. UW140]|uniref:NAD(P)H dehydrogenase assembly family protein n=1 Tax=Synechococcus sp. UW140 TaxID=368503 RepID=UPI003137B769
MTDPSEAIFAVGSLVKLQVQQPWLKTAAAMPVLRPADLVGLNEQGEVVAIHAMQQRAVKFRRGTFLLPVSSLSSNAEPSANAV